MQKTTQNFQKLVSKLSFVLDSIAQLLQELKVDAGSAINANGFCGGGCNTEWVGQRYCKYDVCRERKNGIIL